MFKKNPRNKYNFGFISSGIKATFGAGKTLLLSSFAYDNMDEYNIIYANYHLNDELIPNFMYLDSITEDIILDLRKNSLLLLHEAVNYFDRRYCMKGSNNRIMYALFQMRKRKTDVFGDIPRLQYLEKRVTDNATHYYQCYGNPYYTHPIYDSYFIFSEMDIIPSRFSAFNYFEERGRYVRNMKKYYQCYDTNEALKIKQDKKTKTRELNDDIKNWM